MTTELVPVPIPDPSAAVPALGPSDVLAASLDGVPGPSAPGRPSGGLRAMVRWNLDGGADPPSELARSRDGLVLCAPSARPITDPDPLHPAVVDAAVGPSL